VNENLPSVQLALKILSDVGCSERVVSHCKAVSALAVKFAKNCESKGITVDVNLVEVGGLLHDIGRSKTHDITHAVVGVEIAKFLGLPESLILIIEHHIGGGIGAQEAKNLGLPVKDYFPETLEEKLVAYADKLISGSEIIPIEHTINHFSEKLGPNHPAVNHVIKLHEEIFPLVGDTDAHNNPA